MYICICVCADTYMYKIKCYMWAREVAPMYTPCPIHPQSGFPAESFISAHLCDRGV